MRRIIGIYGGAFDPVHYGHLRTGIELLEQLGLDEVRFVPAAAPPHRSPPVAPGSLRLRMLRAALKDEPRLVADGRELARPGPSYTVDTLAELHADFPGQSFCLLLGMDAFLALPDWYRWQELLDLAHIVVAHRPGWVAPTTGPIGELVQARRTDDPTRLATGSGRVCVAPVTQLEISSTQLRAGLRNGRDPRFLIPDAVRQLVFDTECYDRPIT